MPKRVQRRRDAGWRVASAQIVDRSSRYGNPWRIIDDHILLHPDSITQAFGSPAEARQAASSHYEAWLNGQGPDEHRAGRKIFSRSRVLADLWRLKDRDLACTCPLPTEGEPDHCHAQVLLRMAGTATQAQRYCTGDRCEECTPDEECCEATCGCCPAVDAHDHCRLAPGSEEDSKYCDQHGEGWLMERSLEAQRRYELLRDA